MVTRKVVWLGATAGAVALFAGCASLVGIESDRYVVDAGVDAGIEASVPADARHEAAVEAATVWPSGWTCLNAPVPATPSGNVELKMVVSDATSQTSTMNQTGTPLPGADVKSCARLDFNCASPLIDVVTDDAGTAILTVPGGFDGYDQIEATGFSRAIIVREPQLANDVANQAIVTTTDITLSANLAGINQDPNKSIAVVTVDDCTSTTAAGIQFEVGQPGPGEQVVYLQTSLPTPSATMTDSSTGSALIFNVPPGTLEITAKFATDQRVIRSIAALTRAGWVTYITIRPDQAVYTSP